MNKSIDDKKGRCIGILYALKRKDKDIFSARSTQVSIIEPKRAGKIPSDYEICVERKLVGEGIEVRATGVTLKMLKKFSVDEDFDHDERKAIINFLTNGDDEMASNLSDDQLRVAARIFLKMGNETILEVKDLGAVLDEMEKYEDLWAKRGGLDKKILKYILNWTSLSGKVGSAALLRVLGENPILWRGEDALVKNEIFKEIMKSDNALELLLELRDCPQLWEPNGALNSVSLAVVLASNNFVNALDELKVNGFFENISKIETNELLRHIVMAVIGNNGKVNVEIVQKIRKLVNIDDARHHAHVHRILDLIENDVEFKRLIEAVKMPRNVEGSETVHNFIRTMLQVDESEQVTRVDAQRAVLGAVLSDIRQGKVGSCYGTAIAICVHDSIPHLMVEDLKSMVEKGYFVRKRIVDNKQVKERFYVTEDFPVVQELSQWNLNGDDLCKKVYQLSLKYPEFKAFFSKIDDAVKQGHWSDNWLMNSLFSKPVYNVTSVFSTVLMDHYGVTADDLTKEEELKKLAKDINVLTVEATLNNDTALDKKIQSLIDDYEEKVNKLRDKKSNIELYKKALLNLNRILYTEYTGMSLLTKSWEYAILSAELREVADEHKISSKKVPLMMRELFKETLFNKDQSEIFIAEMSKVLKTMQVLENRFSVEQKKQLSRCLIEIVKIMKTIVDKRITVSTQADAQAEEHFVVGTIYGTTHYLTYIMGEENARKFKVLNSEEEYSTAVLGCAMEAFGQVLEQDMDNEIKDFLIDLKGILGDQLKSKGFRDTIQSFLVHTVSARVINYFNFMYSGFEAAWRVPSVYFGEQYARNFQWIERSVGLADRLIGPKRMEDVDREDHFVKIMDILGRLSIDANSSAIFLIACMAGMAFNFTVMMGALIFWMLLYMPMILASVSSRSAEDALIHFIEASKSIYTNVKNHDEWIKYPIVMSPWHVCTLMPFNENIKKIVESGEDIKQSIQQMIASPEKTIMAVMDSNAEEHIYGSCYYGFELGGGSIRTVFLNSKLEVTGDAPISFFNNVFTVEATYQSVDNLISEYKSRS